MIKILKLNVNSILITRNIAITLNFERAQLKKLAYLYRYNKPPCFPRIVNYFFIAAPYILIPSEAFVYQQMHFISVL